MIRVEQLSLKRGKRDILRGVDMNLETGKIQVLLGQNGAGKSTLLECVAGLNSKYTGKIYWGAEALQVLKAKDLARRRAVLRQQLSLNFPMQVDEFVAMGAYAYGLGGEVLQRKVQEVLQEVDMEAYALRQFQTLSGGEQKRVMLAKCLLQLLGDEDMASRFLLLDEPIASLDVQQQQRFIRLVKRLVAKYKFGVFAVLHDLNISAQLADIVFLLKDGKIYAQGTPISALTQANLKATLGIDSIIQRHPVLDCPQILSLP